MIDVDSCLGLSELPFESGCIPRPHLERASRVVSFLKSNALPLTGLIIGVCL